MKPITYGRRAAKRARSYTEEHGINLPHERPTKRAKVVTDLSLVDTDFDDVTSDNAPVPSQNVERKFSEELPQTPQRSFKTSLSRTATELQDPLSPKTSVEDSSGTFGFTNQNPASPSRNTGIVKRMLSRSRTESSIPNSSSRSFDFTRNVANSRTQDDKRTVVDVTKESSSPSSAKSVTPQKISKSVSLDDTSSPPIKAQSTNMRTYAGSSRSFLVALPAISISAPGSQSIDVGESMLNNQGDLEVHETYSDLRARWGVDDSEDDPYPLLIDRNSPRSKRKGKLQESRSLSLPLQNTTSSDLKSITELRNKGESRRFQDEVGYLFEGLDPDSNIGVRRGSTVEIITKFSDLEFARKAKVADFTVQAWGILREAGGGDGDKVLDSALVVFAALVTRDLRDLVDLANRTDLVPVLFKILSSLERKSDPLSLINGGLSDVELRKAGLPRTEKSLLASLNKVITKKSGVVNHEVSNRLLITIVLVSLPPSFHRFFQLTVLLESLFSEMSSLPSRVSGYASGLSLLPPMSPTVPVDIPLFAHIDNCLCLLESFLLGRWNNSEEDTISFELTSRKQDLVQGLIACCLVTDLLTRDPNYEEMLFVAHRCLESALRVLVNLSHENGHWCQALLQDRNTIPMVIRFIITAHKQRYGRSGLVKRECDTGDVPVNDESNIHAFDRLCLALGLLTNLVQVEEKAKDLSRETTLNLSCPNKRSCLQKCNCSSRISSLECLTGIYLQHCKNTMSEDETNPIIHGHMAILFGLMMRDNVPNQRAILASLPGSTVREKLVPLVETAQEFVELYGRVLTKATGMGIESHNILDGAGDDMTNHEESSSREGRGESIARDVVAFLEILCDSPDP